MFCGHVSYLTSRCCYIFHSIFSLLITKHRIFQLHPRSHEHKQSTAPSSSLPALSFAMECFSIFKEVASVKIFKNAHKAIMGLNLNERELPSPKKIKKKREHSFTHTQYLLNPALCSTQCAKCQKHKDERDGPHPLQAHRTMQVGPVQTNART